MRHYFLHSIFLTLAVILITACDMQQAVDLDLEQPESRLVIEAYAEPGQPYQVLVTRTASYTNPEDLELESGLDVQVHNGKKWISIPEQMVIDTAGRRVNNYTDTTRLWPEVAEGVPYKLQIKAGDKLIEGESHMLPPVVINSIEVKTTSANDSIVALVVEIEDQPEVENYYRLTIHTGDYIKSAPRFQGIFTDNNSMNGKLRLASDFSIDYKSSQWTVSIYHLEPAYYEFLNSLEMARMANYNPYQEPATIKSTISGGVGVFAALTVTREQVELMKLPHSKSQ